MATITKKMQREYTACSLITILVLTCPISALNAQTALGTASVYQDSLSVLQPVAAPDTTGSVADVAVPADDRVERTRPSLRHLPLSATGWRIAGESGSLNWQIYMTAAEAAQSQRFRLSYAPSISVLPDVSTIAVKVNDTDIARVGMAAPNDLQPMDFAIPPNVLRAGFNTLKIAVDERHRVDCSTDATYELWTEINPRETGFSSIRNPLRIAVGELAALAPRADGRLVIRIAYAGKIKPHRIEQTIVASQAIALASAADAAVVSFTQDADAVSGIDVMLGTQEELAGQLSAFPNRGEIIGPTLQTAFRNSSAAPTLIVTGRTDAELTEAIDQLVAIGMQARAKAGADKGVGHAAISGGETIRFQDLGLSNLEFSGRLFRVPIAIDMPTDFLVADYGKLSVDLNGAYAAGLLPGAQVQVNVNGKDTASVPLTNTAGGLFRHNNIFVPLTALRPGRNIIEVAASLPSTRDKSCDTSMPIADAAERFLLLGDTAIRFPSIARVGQLPDLSQTATGGYPYGTLQATPTLYIPKPDSHAMSAALTLAVRLALSAGRPVPFNLALANPGPQSNAGLLVAPARALDPTVMSDIGLDPGAIQRGWKDRISPEQRNDHRLLTGVSSANTSAAPPILVAGVTRNRPSEAWASLLNRRSLFDQLTDWIGNGWHMLVGWAGSAASAVQSRLPSGGTEAFPELGPASSLVVAQGYRGSDRASLITVVTAPDSATLAETVEALVDPARWSDLFGRIAVMDVAGRVLDTVKARDVRFTATQPASLRNMRLIAAGWLSLHPATYVAAAMMLAGLLALLSRALVKAVGRSNP